MDGVEFGDGFILTRASAFPDLYSGEERVQWATGRISGSHRFGAVIEGNCSVRVRMESRETDANRNGDLAVAGAQTA